MTQVFDLATLNGSNGFKINTSLLGGSDAGDVNGISGAGDVNGDGFDDIVIGDKGTSNYGSSNVIFGKNTPFSATFDSSTLNGNNGFQLIRDVYGANRTTTAGDFNGDGFDDLLIAGTTYTAFSASIFFGKGAGFSGTQSLSTALQDKNTGISIVGLESEHNNNEITVSSAGDINGDHIDDIILGLYGGYYEGESYVVFGKSSFASNSINVQTLNGTDGFRLHGVYGGIYRQDNFGRSLSAGDINGDGYGDLIVGASSGGNNPTYGGSSYVVFGKASGFAANLEMTSLDGTNGFRLDGISKYDLAGHSVSTAGDINGDGFADVLIGAPRSGVIGNETGSGYVVFGKASGFDAVVNLASLNGSDGFTINGVTDKDGLGSSVSSAGDVNGDGLGDILIGAPGTDYNGDSSGSVYVIFGKSTGFNATLDLANLADNAGFRIDGLKALDGLGRYDSNISGAGDINGDGFDDLMVSHGTRFAPNEHSSYVIFGRSDFFSDPEKVIKGTNKGDMLVGTKAAERFEAGNGNDTLIGKGGADTYLAGNGNDYIRISDLNFKLVNGGRGNGDTLGIAAVDANLDLAKFSGKIMGIEKIYLYGQSGSDSGVTLNATQLKALSDTSNKLIVNGNQGDYVHITDDGWQDKGIYNNFHTYTNGDAQLLVGVNVMVEFI
ncbi:MAG: FG-GAP-like repeat-containing protein [Nitrosomonas sp.]|nr:FG-GAP-like repeat-containing protein [Nitrosomonas sp.]